MPRDRRSLAEDGTDAEYDNAKRRAAIISGKENARREGRPAGRINFGLRRIYEQTTRKWLRDEPDPDVFGVVREIITRCADGEGYAAITRDLNQRGILSPQGVRWSPEGVTWIAGNPIYEPFVPESVAARRRLAEGRATVTKPTTAKYRYSEVLHCEVCGKLARGTTRHGNTYYGCRAGHAYVAMGAADRFLDDLAAARLSSPDALELFAPPDDAGVLAAENEAASWEQKLTEATEAYMAGQLPVQVLAKITTDAKVKAKAARVRAAKLRVPSALHALTGTDLDEVRAKWDALTIGARKDAIRALMPDVTLKQGRHLDVGDRIDPQW